ncbi:hypothetical protein TrST_g5739 [Triparma strigata]|uniref:EGF-like domain-containing protein n=1 Tax=Triparma strigata TaxID=1606541 RepID=A0A9W7DX96_9STRA|nr:hypothetical protein TrST_g5739 [Triparma strigata]
MIDSAKYCGTSGPSGGSFTAGQQVTFTSSEFHNENPGYLRPGFEICTGDLCVASMSPSDDGSDGNFYCINGGTVFGIPGSCTCTCKVGSEGPNCATASATCPAEIGYTGTPPDCIAGPVVLGGSSTGSCYVNGACFGTGSADGTYNSNEACTFTFSDDAGFAVGRFNTEGSYDKLTVGGVEYDGTSGPSDGSVTAGQEMSVLLPVLLDMVVLAVTLLSHASPARLPLTMAQTVTSTASTEGL